MGVCGCVCVCDTVCVCVVIDLFWTSGLWTHQPGSQEEDHTGIFHLPSAVLALIFLARRVQASLSLADREVECCIPMK